MSEQATAAQRFTLDEDKARAWLERAVAKYEYENGDGDEPEDSEENGELPDIGANWEAHEYEQENTVYLLVRLAGDRGIITAPAGMDLDFRYSDDSDGGFYCFHVGLAKDIFAELASYSEEMRKIGDRDATGLDAAMAVLREAVDKANYTLAELDKYVASRQSAPVPERP